MSWHEHAIWWHVYPLGFLGAEPVLGEDGGEPQHRLPRLVDWLDYAVELGVSGLALGPIFTSHSHGYDTTDYFTIDPRLGDRADFDHLVAAAHERGLKIMLDGVFNHVGRRHPAFRRAVEGGPDALEAGWFHLEWPDGGPPAEPRYATFEGHEGLVALDHEHEGVVTLVADVMRYWLAAGADAWRLDAAYAVPPAFWQRVLPLVREEFPDTYVVGEVIHGDYPAIVQASGMDAVTQYELWKAIWSALNDRNLFELAHALQRHSEMLDTFPPLTFVGNHDVTRLATRLTDRRLIAHALVVLMTVGGTPSLYYGDEQGFEGLKEDRLGGDDAVRQPFPASRDQLAPEGWGVYHLHQELIAVRRRHPWLHRARTRQLQLSNEVLAYESTAEGERIVVVLNLAEETAAAEVAGVGEVLAGGGDLAEGQVRVPAHGWLVAR